MSGATLPTLNACLNALAFVLLVVGRRLVKRGRREAHARVMLAAFAVSAVFLASYLVYHGVVVPRQGHREFGGTGGWKVAYYVLLASHVVLAAVNLPMVIATLVLALRGREDAHRRWARRTWPIWIYVSVTGVVVYLVLYPLNPGPPPG